MIKSLESCSSETALKLSNLEQNLFSMSWDASIIAVSYTHLRAHET